MVAAEIKEEEEAQAEIIKAMETMKTIIHLQEVEVEWISHDQDKKRKNNNIKTEPNLIHQTKVSSLKF